MVDRVLAELGEQRGPFVLVIDDLHELSSAEALEQLTHLLTHLPAHVHAILAARRDLRLRLHQLRLAGELAEIRAAELRFTEEETRLFLAASGITLPDRAAAMLYQRTEGWAAGLRLAAISLARHPDPERFVAEFSGSNRTVAEYLIAEMLERQPEHVQRLLLRTSLLDRVNGELADLLTGRSGSEQILLELEDANAFVLSLDPERTWFRYHHLFSGLLRLELRRTLPEEIPALHRQAAHWFTEHGQAADAIRHLQAAGDWSDAARLLADHSFSLTLDGQEETIRALLRSFQGDSADHPELALVHATDDLARGRLEEAAAHLAVARSYAGTTPPERQHRLRTAIASLDLLLARQRGHFADVFERVNFLATPVTGQSSADIALSSDVRALALMNLGVAEAWSLRLQDSERHLQEGADLARSIGRPYVEVACLAQLGFASKIRSFATARQRCEAAIALAGQHGWDTEPVIAPALATLAGTMIWMGEFDEGERWLRRARHATQPASEPGIRLLLHLIAGMAHAGRGRRQQAFAEFSAAGRIQGLMLGEHALSPQVTGWTMAMQARLGMPDQARASLTQLTSRQAGRGEIRNAAAVICLAEDDPGGARRELQAVLDGTAPVIHDFTLVEAHLLDALARRALGDQRGVNAAAERALSLAEPDRLILPFAMTGSRDILETLPTQETSHAALLADILDVLRGSPPAAGDNHVLGQAEELSPGELRVLRYLPTNLTRPEIASELSVSLNTVSTHIRKIYAKLGASDRSTAVQRARELRLLSSGRSR
jgi:LuxR family transcriptional regulator, maltose regulon positive regulatory protein